MRYHPPVDPSLHDAFHQFFGTHAAVIETAIYRGATVISNGDYEGGLWLTAAIETSEHQVPLRVLDSNRSFAWFNQGNMRTGKTDAMTFSAAANCYAHSHMSFAAHDLGDDKLSRLCSAAYHVIRNFVYENEDMFNVDDFYSITD